MDEKIISNEYISQKKIIVDYLNELVKTEENLRKKILVNEIKQKILSLQKYHPIIKNQIANMDSFYLGEWINFNEVLQILEGI